jgi:hypothetical protein
MNPTRPFSQPPHLPTRLFNPFLTNPLIPPLIKQEITGDYSLQDITLNPSLRKPNHLLFIDSPHPTVLLGEGESNKTQ